jgi:hypothetical protein
MDNQAPKKVFFYENQHACRRFAVNATILSLIESFRCLYAD